VEACAFEEHSHPALTCYHKSMHCGKREGNDPVAAAAVVVSTGGLLRVCRTRIRQCDYGLASHHQLHCTSRMLIHCPHCPGVSPSRARLCLRFLRTLLRELGIASVGKPCLESLAGLYPLVGGFPCHELDTQAHRKAAPLVGDTLASRARGSREKGRETILLLLLLWWSAQGGRCECAVHASDGATMGLRATISSTAPAAGV